MSLTFVVDMNLSAEWLPALTAEGWPAVHWSAVGAVTATDVEIMGWARVAGRVVLTHDLDFGTLLAVTGADAPSVVLCGAGMCYRTGVGPTWLVRSGGTRPGCGRERLSGWTWTGRGCGCSRSHRSCPAPKGYVVGPEGGVTAGNPDGAWDMSDKRLTPAELTRRGIEILSRELGPADAIRFVRQFTNGSGDYTAERGALFAGATLESIVADIKAARGGP